MNLSVAVLEAVRSRTIARLDEWEFERSRNGNLRPSIDPTITGGQCGVVSEMMFEAAGLLYVYGCFHGGGEHIAHVWNVLPDGRIFDGTADQFGLAYPSGVLITAGDDHRYSTTCPDEGIDG